MTIFPLSPEHLAVQAINVEGHSLVEEVYDLEADPISNATRLREIEERLSDLDTQRNAIWGREQ